MPFDYKTASAIARYETIRTETLRDFSYAARQTWDELQLSKRENSSLQREIKNLLGEIDVLKSSLLEAEAAPQPVVPEGFTKWLSAFVEVSNLSGIEDHEIAWTWPSPPNAPEFFANYPALTTGDLRELHALHLAVPPKVSRNDLIELLIATRNQSEGVTADLIIKLLKAGGESDRG